MNHKKLFRSEWKTFMFMKDCNMLQNMSCIMNQSCIYLSLPALITFVFHFLHQRKHFQWMMVFCSCLGTFGATFLDALLFTHLCQLQVFINLHCSCCVPWPWPFSGLPDRNTYSPVAQWGRLSIFLDMQVQQRLQPSSLHWPATKHNLHLELSLTFNNIHFKVMTLGTFKTIKSFRIQ